MVKGKKLWEVLLTDSNGSFRFCKTLPSSQVNSKELRRVVEEVIEEADVKPSTIRFFRGAMFNMVSFFFLLPNPLIRPAHTHTHTHP